MNKYLPIIFIILTIGGVGLLVFHITNDTSDWKDYLSSSLIIIANISMYIAIKKTESWNKKE